MVYAVTELRLLISIDFRLGNHTGLKYILMCILLN